MAGEKGAVRLSPEQKHHVKELKERQRLANERVIELNAEHTRVVRERDYVLQEIREIAYTVAAIEKGNITQVQPL